MSGTVPLSGQLGGGSFTALVFSGASWASSPPHPDAMAFFSFWDSQLSYHDTPASSTLLSKNWTPVDHELPKSKD